MLTALVLAGAAPVAAQTQAVIDRNIGDWRPGGWAKARTGPLTHCSAVMRFPNDTKLIVMMNAPDKLHLGVLTKSGQGYLITQYAKNETELADVTDRLARMIAKSPP